MGSRFSRRNSFTAILGVLILAGVAACGSSNAQLVDADKDALEPSAKVEVSPEADSKDVPVSSELKVSVDDGEMTDMKLLNSDGKEVSGNLREDKSSWVPDEPLAYGSEYTVAVSVVDKDDIKGTIDSTFTTMDEPSNQVNASLWNGDGKEFGKAMPLMVDFPRDFEVPEDKREAVENRLFVSSEPEQPGAWHWFSGNHLEYRPEGYWEPGTKITVRSGLGGMPLGDDVYGAHDVNATVTISETDREVHVDDENKKLVATENGEEVKSMDVSLGKKSSPSYSGTMIVMEKKEETVFDTTDEPGCDGKEDGKDCYKTDIDFAQRLTWSGQFIHSAPWSVKDQGKRNVSHGCVNVSEKNAKWIFKFTQVGDPVVVENTGHALPAGDGFTAYDLSWDDFLAGSYAGVDGEKQEKQD